MTTTLEPGRPRTYGGWRQPASPGIGPLKLGPTLALLAGMVLLLVVAMAAGLLAALAVAGVLLILGAPAAVPYKGRTLYSLLSNRSLWWRHTASGRQLYRSGLAGVTPNGLRSLPGLLANIHLWQAQDALGRDYALVEIRPARQWAVVLRVAAQAGALVDPEDRDQWVAGWGEYLALLGSEGGVVQAATVVETVPEAGALLASHVLGMVRPDTPEFARQVMADAAVQLPSGVSETLGYVTITFSERTMGITRDRSAHVTAQAVAEEIGRRLPGLSAGLKAAGASAGEPMTSPQLAQRVREAYDPAVALPFAESRAVGELLEADWADAGPTAAEETATDYRHDSGRSRTWEALGVPPGVIRDTLLERLIAPNEGAPRKRVTLLYRPVDASETATVVDRDLRAAINREGRRKGLAHAHDSAHVRNARQAADEEADGAGVVSFSLLVTITVPDGPDADSQFDRACATVERAARGARIRLSPVYGSQAAAFAGGLGVGLSLPDLSVLPSSVRTHV